MISALTGAVIINVGSLMTYKKKCENCGTLESGTTSEPPPQQGHTRQFSFRCPKCGNHQEVRIYGG